MWSQDNRCLWGGFTYFNEVEFKNLKIKLKHKALPFTMGSNIKKDEWWKW